MAFPPELTSFANEEAFTDLFVIPLLQRLGFSVVVNFHGTSEFGKDVIFADVDRFANVVYHGLQVKYVSSTSLSASAELIDDAKQAFNNPFTHPQTGSTERISTFFAVNGGSISDQATTNFFNALQPIYGANVRLLDGKALASLDRLAAMNSGNLVKPQLSGMLLEIRSNRMTTIHNAKRISEYLNGADQPPTAKFRLGAAQVNLSQPLLMQDEFIAALHRYWGLITILNNMIDAVSSPLATASFRNEKAEIALKMLGSVEDCAKIIEEHVTSHLAKMGTTIGSTVNTDPIE